MLAVPDTAMVPISVRLSKTMLELVDSVASDDPDGRSGFIRKAIEEKLARERAA